MAILKILKGQQDKPLTSRQPQPLTHNHQTSNINPSPNPNLSFGYQISKHFKWTTKDYCQANYLFIVNIIIMHSYIDMTFLLEFNYFQYLSYLLTKKHEFI